MRWLSRATASVSDRVRNESGAVIVFVAVALVVLLGMTAFVIDFGRIWQERRELQAGATAGVLAVAEDCARDLCDLAYNELATAELYADANAIDGAASVFSIDLDLTDQAVQVVTATENTEGGDTMDMLFAGIVGFGTITVGADAAAAWGTPLQAATLPLIISDCEWRKDEPGWPDGGSATLPDSGANLSSYPMATINLHEGPFVPEDLCTIQPGLDLPGGFGWIDTSGACVSEVSEEAWIGADPGSSPPTSCIPADFADLLGKPIAIPYFSETQGGGNISGYRATALAAFVIAGYDFGGPYTGGSVSCGPATSCLTGWFVNYVSNAGAPGDLGGEDRGFTVIKLIG
jgi:Flp pilus assembly protein TadG